MALCQNVLSLTVTVAATLTVLLCSQLMLQSRAKAQEPSSSETSKSPGPAPSEIDRAINENARRMLEQGRHIFRYDTFGSEAYWGDELQLHRALAGEKNGGVGDGVSPKTALAAGLKVDADALPDSLRQQLKAGKVDLNDPATVALLKLNAVVGVTGFFDQKGNLRSMGLQCAFCHSTVDDSFAPGIGKRLDAWANRDLNVGLVISLGPNLKPLTALLGADVATVKKVLNRRARAASMPSLTRTGKRCDPTGSRPVR